jgi:hypothetical protein
VEDGEGDEEEGEDEGYGGECDGGEGSGAQGTALMAWHATGIVFAFVGGEHWGWLVPEQLYSSRSHRTLRGVN